MLFLKNLTQCNRIASTAANRVQNAAIVVRKTMAHRLRVAFCRIKIHTYNRIIGYSTLLDWQQNSTIIDSKNLVSWSWYHAKSCCSGSTNSFAITEYHIRRNFTPWGTVYHNLKPSFGRLFPLGGSSFQIALYLLVTKKRKMIHLGHYSATHIFLLIFYYIQWNLVNLVANGPKKNWLY